MDDQLPPTQDPDDARPMQRAHRFFQRAAPVLRDASEAIERHGGIDGVRELVVERATELVRQVDEVVANAGAIEGEVVERVADAVSDEPVAPAETVQRVRRRLHYVELAILVAAATFGALALQRRLR
jgi:predicted ArsR family transcriptional regulator